MLILLSAVNEGIGACFVGAFQDNKVSEILELPKDVRPIGIICIGYPAEKPEKLERIDVKALVHYEKYGRRQWTELYYGKEFTYEIKKAPNVLYYGIAANTCYTKWPLHTLHRWLVFISVSDNELLKCITHFILSQWFKPKACPNSCTASLTSLW